MFEITDAALIELIRNVSAAVDESTPETIQQKVEPLRKYLPPNCHVGRGEEVDNTDKGFRLQLEWFGGQILGIVDNNHWFCVNSWINCTEKFTTRKELPNV